MIITSSAPPGCRSSGTWTEPFTIISSAPTGCRSSGTWAGPLIITSSAPTGCRSSGTWEGPLRIKPQFQIYIIFEFVARKGRNFRHQLICQWAVQNLAV